ncbi:protein O-GlcNAcase-like [Calypte anna]|uniref:protein O-GlcNAcase-like n=1 Tax=Calypte anna TaxID=9244 RepID=UPI0011C3F558|nr:protein O-GlcNAcase-like [Calypte anna]
MAGRPPFLCGVVEGFYGRPWSMEQRKLLFQWLKRRGLNCYMYAPKDELKHRLLWREPYTEQEAAHMQSLIKAAQEQSVEFVFAISAGQDMVFSSAGDQLLLQQKLRQVAAMGCHAFALLFDDIDPCMCQADRDVFPSLAQAQASVANEMYRRLGQPSIFLFCPTEYCSSLCSPSPGQSHYLLTLGQELLPGISMVWTGPKVVSQELSATLLEEVEGVLRRRPIIWDNLYANDYDCRRVFLGPYTGRAPGLMARLGGLLLNPNCELQANFIPIHTLGTWFQSELRSCAHLDHTGMYTVEALGDRQSAPEGSYSPQEALELALLDWVAEINHQTLEPGGRTMAHPSISLKGGKWLQTGPAGGQETMPNSQPDDSAPSGADQRPCGVAPENGRKMTSKAENDSGSRTSASHHQSLTGDGDQLTTRSRESCKPSSALPSTAGSVQPSGTPVATETLQSPVSAMCCSSGANSSQGLPLPTCDARTSGDSHLQVPSSTQPEDNRVDMPQAPPGSGADTSPGPPLPLSDGAGTSSGHPAALTDGAGGSPGSTAPLTPEENGSSPVALPTLEEARSSPTASVTPEVARSSPMTPVIPEEARSIPSVLLTLKDARSNPTAPLTLEEVRMLVELFYLPYNHGPQAQHILENFRWLWNNSFSVGIPATVTDTCGGMQWRSQARAFQLLCAQTCHLHSRFVSSAGRVLLYDLHPYLWSVRNILLAASAFILWLDGHLLCDPGPKGTWGSCFGWCQSITTPILLAGDAEPWVHRGGLFGELQELLPVGNSCDLFYHPPPLFPCSQLYLLRPLLPLDKGELYRMCRESLDCDPKVAKILAAHPDLLGDRLLGSFLSLSPEYTFVLEDEHGLCGYAAGALCAEGFLQQQDSSWLPAIRHKYPRDLGAGAPALGQDALEEALLFFHSEPPSVPLPVLRRFPSLVQLGTAPRVLDVGASHSLAICLLSALRANGSRGVLCQVSATDRQQLSFYNKLGFVALPVSWGNSAGVQLLGRLL